MRKCEGSVRLCRSRSPKPGKSQSPSRSRTASYSKQGTSRKHHGSISGTASLSKQSMKSGATTKDPPGKAMEHDSPPPSPSAGRPWLSQRPIASEISPAAVPKPSEDLVCSALQEAARVWANSSAEERLFAQARTRDLQTPPPPSEAPDLPASGGYKPPSEEGLEPDLQRTSPFKAGSTSDGNPCKMTPGSSVLPDNSCSLIGQRRNVEKRDSARRFLEAISAPVTETDIAGMLGKQSNGSEGLRVTQQLESSAVRGSLLVGAQHESPELYDSSLASPPPRARVRQPSQSRTNSLEGTHRQVGGLYILTLTPACLLEGNRTEGLHCLMVSIMLDECHIFMCVLTCIQSAC